MSIYRLNAVHYIRCDTHQFHYRIFEAIVKASKKGETQALAPKRQLSCLRGICIQNMNV